MLSAITPLTAPLVCTCTRPSVLAAKLSAPVTTSCPVLLTFTQLPRAVLVAHCRLTVSLHTTGALMYTPPLMLEAARATP